MFHTIGVQVACFALSTPDALEPHADGFLQYEAPTALSLPLNTQPLSPLPTGARVRVAIKDVGPHQGWILVLLWGYIMALLKSRSAIHVHRVYEFGLSWVTTTLGYLGPIFSRQRLGNSGQAAGKVAVRDR